MGWGYYDDEYGYDEPPPPDPVPNAIRIAGEVRAQSKRGAIGTEWWGQQWVAAVERVREDGRLDRGKRYARNGSVTDLEIAYGQAFAHVSGSRGRRYHSYVRLKPFTQKEWDAALDALAQQAIYTAKLLAGEMPSNIEAIFDDMGTSLFPRDRNDIGFDCSCPDWGDPCKHSAAIYYLLAEQLDADPFFLFHLRGRKREDILNELRQRRGESGSSLSATEVESVITVVDLRTELASFWTGSDTNLIRTAPLRHATPYVFRQLGAPPLYKKEFMQIYDTVAAEASKWLGLED